MKWYAGTARIILLLEDFARSIQRWTDCEIAAYQLGIHMGAFDQEDVPLNDFYEGDFDDEYLHDLKISLLRALNALEHERYIVYYIGESMWKWRSDLYPLD